MQKAFKGELIWTFQILICFLEENKD
jgi:hypothetical protein